MNRIFIDVPALARTLQCNPHGDYLIKGHGQRHGQGQGQNNMRNFRPSKQIKVSSMYDYYFLYLTSTVYKIKV